MRAEVRITVDTDSLAFSRMRERSGLWVVTVNSGHIVKASQIGEGVSLDAGDCQLPTHEEILAGDGTWLIYTRAQFIRAAVRVPRERRVEDMVCADVVREFEERVHGGMFDAES